MSTKIAHFADIHILNTIEKLKEQQSQFPKVYKQLENEQPDLILIVGDFLDKFLMNNEAKTIASEFLRTISEYTHHVILTLGNHETNQKNSQRISSIKSLIKIINSEKIIFLDKTEFYNFEQYPSLVFANWNWGDFINPYIDLKEKYDKLNTGNNFFIDLYHNPINTSKNSFGKEFFDKQYLSVDDFKGDLLLLGDIHQRQFFTKDNKVFGAYPSSLFQLNYGESVDKHGFILWNVDEKSKSFTYKEVDVDSDYLYLNVPISIGFDYEDINIELPIVKPYMRVKLKWFDYSANMTRNNEREIKKYLVNKYPQIKEIKVEQNRVDKHDKATANDDRLLFVNQKSVQQEILLDYLKNTIKCEDAQLISDIMLLEDEIDSKVERSATGDDLYSWEIESFYLENFRSHGERWELSWKDLNGLWKIDGLNEQGKTNFWSSVCYLLYGQTLETKKKKKFGDNRFINNKRNLDYCECGGIIIINGERFKIIRRTERKWNRNQTEITACPTTFSIEKIDNDNNVLQNENEVEKLKTLKNFEQCIGSFDDFLRMSVITADTLNSFLSLDESEFIDAILKDAGLDIYEKKLEIYKKSKKESYKKEERIVIDVLTSENEINTLEKRKLDTQEQITVLERDLADKNNRINKGIELKEDEIKKLHKIDEKLKSLDISNVQQQVNSLVKEKEGKLDEIDLLSQKINTLPTTFDETKFSTLKTSKDKLNNDVVNYRHLIKQTEFNIQEEQQNIAKINGEIYLLEREILNINQQIKHETEYQNKLIAVKEQELEVLEKSKVCPSCKQELKSGSDALLAILEKIKTLKSEINTAESQLKNSSQIQTYQNEIQVLNTKIITKRGLITPHDKLITEYKDSIPTINNNIDDLRIKIDDIDTEIKTFDIILKQIEMRSKLLAEKNNIPLQIENIDHKIKDIKSTIELYTTNMGYIIENQKIEEKINTYQNRLNILSNEKNDVLDAVNKLKNVELLQIENKINNIKTLIQKYKEQERKDLVNKLYQESLSRDGIPRLLLLKMKDKINSELQNLLQEVSFGIYFDQDLALKLFDNIKPEAEINVIESSGKQRTFAAFVLKLALRNINNRSINNMLLLDEITSKLIDHSVSEFFNLLDIAKESIDKIMIIEHAYGDELLADHKILVTKDIDGISSIKFNA